MFDYYGIPLSTLPFSADYWQNDSPPLHIPSGCTAGTAGCRVYLADEQEDIALKAAGAYWWMLVMAQVMHIVMCKARRLAILEHGLFNNFVMIYGISIELALIIIFIFVPRLNELLVGLPFPAQFWPVFLVSWAALVIFNEGRKYLGRRNPNGFVQKYINW